MSFKTLFTRGMNGVAVNAASKRSCKPWLAIIELALALAYLYRYFASPLWLKIIFPMLLILIFLEVWQAVREK